MLAEAEGNKKENINEKRVNLSRKEYESPLNISPRNLVRMILLQPRRWSRFIFGDASGSFIPRQLREESCHKEEEVGKKRGRLISAEGQT